MSHVPAVCSKVLSCGSIHKSFVRWNKTSVRWTYEMYENVCRPLIYGAVHAIA